MQRAACNAQHAPHNMQHAARNMRGVKFRARANDPAAAAALAEMCKRETGQHFAPGSITMRPTAPNPSQVRRGTRLRAGAGRSRDCDDRYAQLVHHELQSPAPPPRWVRVRALRENGEERGCTQKRSFASGSIGFTGAL